MKIRLFFILPLILTALSGAKIKDIANVIGVRDNQLIGYGLVVGLNGTGDSSSSEFTRQAISSMLQSVNVKVDSRRVKSKNVAAVMVTAKLPPFSRHGDMLDIEVSSIGDAKSIVGGTLILTPLKAVDGEVYALAQGRIDSGFSKDGKSSKKATTVNIFDAALVEREVDFDISRKSSIRLSLRESDFGVASRIESRLNSSFGLVARAIDSRTIELRKPDNFSMVEFLARVNETEISYSGANRVVIDQKSGTVVSGLDVAVEPVMVTHGDLTIKIMPTGLSLDSEEISVKNSVVKLAKREVTVANIARVLQKLGAKPSDIISIMKTIKRAGGIRAKLEII